MKLGIAGTIAVAHISGDFIQRNINYWLAINPDVEVIDIKISTCANHEKRSVDALIIYRKDY